MTRSTGLSDYERRGANASATQTEPAAYSIDEFCRAHCISRAMFYKLAKGGHAPRLMSVGTHKRISREAAAEWRLEREADAAALAEITAQRGSSKVAA